jgi:hypothetical protein
MIHEHMFAVYKKPNKTTDNLIKRARQDQPVQPAHLAIGFGS